MPTNLNALVRYKTIDNCLRNNTTLWTIERLQGSCTKAMGEYRGLYKKISERTIRDDIRIMRSEILGFNAPIVCKDGCYKYTDPNYSIFDVPIKAKHVIEKTIAFLEEHIDSFESEEVYDIMYQLRKIAGDSSSMDVMFSLKPADSGHSLSNIVEEEDIIWEKQKEEKPDATDVNWGHICRLFFN